jgi:hypothetical protein
MNITMALTLDGLVRALRWKAHDLADGVEEGYPASGRSAPREPSAHPGIAKTRAGGAGDDLGSR